MKEHALRQQVADKSPNRRKFLRNIGIAGSAGAAVLTGAIPARADAITDVDIVQFALNLEYLEAEFYTVATTGKTIDQLGVGINGTGTAGPTTGGHQVDTSHTAPFTHDIAIEIALDERAHVTFLRNTLMSMGVTPIAKPAINLNALGFGFGNALDFLKLARAFEDVGVTAYAGAAPLLQSKTILGAAARILATEAEHVGNIRLQVARLGIPTLPALDGVDILPPPSGAQFFSVDNNALVQVRTPGQVLFIVYGFVAGVSKGGFFPNGVNGNIKTSSASA